MLVSGNYHNKIVYCNLMSQVVMLPVLVVGPEDVSGVWVVEQLGGRDEIASYERDVCHICSINIIKGLSILGGDRPSWRCGYTSRWRVGPLGEDRGNLHSIDQPARH